MGSERKALLVGHGLLFRRGADGRCFMYLLMLLVFLLSRKRRIRLRLDFEL
jgi:hypothetical protein